MDFETSFYMVDFEEKSLVEDNDSWKFTAYAAVFNNRDLGGDIIVPGAFKNFLSQDKLPRLHVEHKMRKADGSLYDQVGLITDAEEDGKGLLVEGELLKTKAEARDVVAMLKPRGKRGVRGYKGMSIGYKTIKSSLKTSGGTKTRYLEDLWLPEVSFVESPMNPKADLIGIKSAQLVENEWKSLGVREREARLIALGMSEGLAKRFIRLEREAPGELKNQREAGDEGRLPDFASLIRAAIPTR